MKKNTYIIGIALMLIVGLIFASTPTRKTVWNANTYYKDVSFVDTSASLYVGDWGTVETSVIVNNATTTTFTMVLQGAIGTTATTEVWKTLSTVVNAGTAYTGGWYLLRKENIGTTDSSIVRGYDRVRFINTILSSDSAGTNNGGTYRLNYSQQLILR
jgi:hypothetical protein